ncbi:thermonuclease family protein [Agrobacterium sp. BETTINA12B]|nr:thermonuclease family protein [Agrobacterium sp. BETTINA12B]
MLSETEISYFRNRIDDSLRNGQPTRWQRQFLYDLEQKFARYGPRTRLTEKQLSILRRLTHASGAQVIPFAERRPVSQSPAFRKQSRRGYGYRRLQIKIAVFLILLTVVLVSRVFHGNFISMWPSSGSEVAATTSASQFSSQSFTITDGDTIRMGDGTPVRLAGFNAPEVFHPQCDSEAALGNKATERLKQLVASGSTSLTRIACSCPPGTEGTDMCNFGRSCGILKVDGQDVGQTLISEGLAVPFMCGRTSCPKTPRPWCG